MMTSDSFINDDWPDLHTTTTMNYTKQSLTITNNDPSDDWEVLNDDTTNISISQNGNDHNTTTTSTTTTTDFVVVHDDVHDPTITIQSERSSPINRKMLHHSISSPILSGTVGTSNDINHDDDDDAVVIGGDNSFTLVSDVASVWTQSTVGNHTTTTTIKTVSFRDAILLSPTKIPTQQNATIQQCIQPKQRSRIQPRFVVVPSPSKHMNIRRCTKSTGDLQKLSHIMSLSETDRTNYVSYNNEYNDNEESDSCSSSSNHDHTHDDEFYYRKAIGCASHMNGLKLRPDEAKRKNMILYKKNQQRQQQQMTKRN